MRLLVLCGDIVILWFNELWPLTSSVGWCPARNRDNARTRLLSWLLICSISEAPLTPSPPCTTKGLLHASTYSTPPPPHPSPLIYNKGCIHLLPSIVIRAFCFHFCFVNRAEVLRKKCSKTMTVLNRLNIFIFLTNDSLICDDWVDWQSLFIIYFNMRLEVWRLPNPIWLMQAGLLASCCIQCLRVCLCWLSEQLGCLGTSWQSAVWQMRKWRFPLLNWPPSPSLYSNRPHWIRIGLSQYSC